MTRKAPMPASPTDRAKATPVLADPELVAMQAMLDVLSGLPRASQVRTLSLVADRLLGTEKRIVFLGSQAVAPPDDPSCPDPGLFVLR